jgi:hypothetical protein
MKNFNYERRYQLYLRKRWWWRRPNLYLIAAAPKSGSTWTAAFLSQVLNLPLTFAFDMPDQSEPKLSDLFLSRKGVIQQHCRWTAQTKIFIEELKVKTVVLVRNLPDTIVSIRDHLRKENTGNWPWGFIDSTILQKRDDDLYDFLIEHIAPWYVAFFASWDTSGNKMITYEHILEDPQAILKAFQIEKNSNKIEQAIACANKGFTRFNVGKAGRGAEFLSKGQIENLKNLTRHYPNTDFTKMGL